MRKLHWIWERKLTKEIHQERKAGMRAQVMEQHQQ